MNDREGRKKEIIKKEERWKKELKANNLVEFKFYLKKTVAFIRSVFSQFAFFTNKIST